MITGEMRLSKRTTLHNYLATHFDKKLTGEEVKKPVIAIVACLSRVRTK